MPRIKKNFARRFVMSVFGDKFVDFSFYRKIKSGTVDFDSFTPQGADWQGSNRFLLPSRALEAQSDGLVVIASQNLII